MLTENYLARVYKGRAIGVDLSKNAPGVRWGQPAPRNTQYSMLWATVKP